MLHVLDFEGNIIDFISDQDNYLENALMVKDKAETLETFEFDIDSDRAENMRERNRIIVQDSNGQYREFIIVRIEDDLEDRTFVECNASYLEDINTAKPLAPGKYEAMTTSQALKEVLKDTGWQASESTEYGGTRSTSWTAYHTPYEVLKQLGTTYDMEIDFYIELGSNKVKGRYVEMHKPKPLFKGKEITYGKDLTGMSKTVDISELHTALMALGPEDENGNREVLTVVDNTAHQQFGLPNRYIWGIYEPQSEDTSMTAQRLKTLATTQLNKDKQAAVSYEITAADISQQFPHEKTAIGDIVRVKDREFNPPLYIEAEVMREEYNPIKKESTYTFGNIVEYLESTLRKDFMDRLNDIRQKMNDSVTNLNTIIEQTTAGNLETFERKIFKSDTAPANPVNDMLWYDTSNPEVAVLRRYWNGEWREETVSNVEQIGGVTREKALFSELSNTFINLNIQHSKLLSEVYEVIDSEYLVDTALKQQVQQNLDNTINVYHTIETNLESMTPETATIGKLVDTQALFLKYRELLQTLYNSLENAKIAIDDRFKLLQSQYTDEKFNAAMSKVAESIGGTWDVETGQLLADIPSQQELEDALKTYINGQDAALKQLIDGEVNSKITQTKNELSSNISAVSAKVDGIQVGGRNLVTDSHFYSGSINGWSPIYGTQKVTNHILSKKVDELSASNRIERQFSGLSIGEKYTLSIYVKTPVQLIWRNLGNADIVKTDNALKTNEFYTTSVTFTPKETEVILRGYVANAPVGSVIELDWFKLEKGTVGTDWTQAPEDFEDKIELAKRNAIEASEDYANAQDELFSTKSQAYADGIVSKEEERAIKDAQDKLDIAKSYAEDQDLLLKTQTEAYADGLITAEEERAIKEAQDNLKAAKEYAEAQDNLKQIESQAYADGVVTAEEQRAIEDANAKLEQAKDFATQKYAEAIESTQEMIQPIKTTQIQQSSDIKQLKDGFTLKADKKDITTLYDENIKPLEKQVNNNSSELLIQSDRIDSKVSNEQYTADVNDIVSKLNSAESQREQLSNAINDRVTIKEYTDNKTATTNQINTAMNNVQVGGRNLVTDSHFYSGSINGWSSIYGNQKVENHILIKEVTTLTAANRIERQFSNLIAGETYTLTVYANVPIPLSWRNFMNANVLTSSNTPIVNQYHNNSVTFTATDSTIIVRGYVSDAPVGSLIKIDWFKLEKGNKATDWTPAPEDVQADIDKTKAETDKTLSVMQTQINQNGTDINARATKEEFNASKKTLSNVISDLSINTTTGLTLSYDENGNIQSHTVGPDGIMLKGDRVNIDVNKDFQVLAGNVNNKVGKDEIINRLNLSPEGLDINVNNLGIRGGDTANYLSIKNQEILSRGTFTRTWGGVTDTPSAEIGIKDGYILSRNKKTGYNLYMTEKGLSTMMSGGVGSEQAGALEFHYDLFNDNSRGVRLSSTYGVVFLHSENSRIYTRSRYTTNIETWEASVYIRPQVYSRPGTNEFSFYLKDNDNAKDTDGTLLFGEIYDDKGQAGSGLRFKKAGFSGQTEGEYEPVVYATDKFGNIGTGSFHARNFYGDFQSRSGYLYLKADDRVRITDYKGYNNGNPTYGDLQCRWIQSESIRTTSTNFYIGTSTGEVRITNNLLYNGGDIGYKDIRFKNYVAMSSERYKYDIRKWDYSVLDAYRNDLQLYSYKNKSEEEEEYVRDHHGIIIEREIPIEWRHGDGFDGNEVLFWNTKAIQELVKKVDELEEQINESK